MSKRVLLINPALPPRQVQHPANYLDCVIAAERGMVDKALFEQFVWPRYQALAIEKTFHHYPEQTASLGLLSLASVLRSEGHDVKYVQVTTDPDNSSAIVDESDTYDFVGITAICTTIEQSLGILSRIKSNHPRVTTALGGPHVTHLAPRDIGDLSSVDVVVRGEGETVLPRILHDLSRDSLCQLPGLDVRTLHGLVTTSGTNVLTTAELQILPAPAFDLVPELEHTQIYLQFSRGCHHRCCFCSETGAFRMFSTRQITEMLDALEMIRQHNLVFIVDSTFISSPQFVSNVCDAIHASRTTNYFSVQTRIDSVSLEALRRLYDAQIINFFFGVENTSEPVLRTANKKLDWDAIVRGFTVARSFFVDEQKYDVPPYRANFIQGLPGEATEERYENLLRRKQLLDSGLVLNVNDSIFQPTPGSVFWRNASVYGLALPTPYRPTLRGAVPDYRFDNAEMSPLGVFLHHLEMRQSANQALIQQFGLRSIHDATAAALTKGTVPASSHEYVKC